MSPKNHFQSFLFSNEVFNPYLFKVDFKEVTQVYQLNLKYLCLTFISSSVNASWSQYQVNSPFSWCGLTKPRPRLDYHKGQAGNFPHYLRGPPCGVCIHH